MRGGIIVKFNLEFPYDANIDKIRKVIKKVGKAMLKDEELGRDFIKPVKSQGVREIANAVMVIRVKFTANFGAHFVIRREAYKRITEALNKRGFTTPISKKVIVDIPPGPGGSENSAQMGLIAKRGGAAVEAMDGMHQMDQPDVDV
jgi:small-conductance mechanosensitive channel